MIKTPKEKILRSFSSDFIHDTDPAPPLVESEPDTEVDNPIQEITEVDNAVPGLSSPDNSLYESTEKPKYYEPLILILIAIATVLSLLIYCCF